MPEHTIVGNELTSGLVVGTNVLATSPHISSSEQFDKEQ